MSFTDDISDWSNDYPQYAWLIGILLVLILLCLFYYVTKHPAQPQESTSGTEISISGRENVNMSVRDSSEYGNDSSSGTVRTPKVIGQMAGWTAIADGKTGKVYYWNKALNQTLWQRPAEFTKPMPTVVNVSSQHGQMSGNQQDMSRERARINLIVDPAEFPAHREPGIGSTTVRRLSLDPHRSLIS